MTRDEMIKKLRELLDDERFAHSLAVEKTAIELAKIHGVDEKKASIAGLLHDCAKNVKYDPLAFCGEHGLEQFLPEYQDLPLPVLHAPIGGHMVKRCFAVDDTEISSAIACHTSGKVDMSDLDKVIFLADYTEPLRGDEPWLNEVRQLSKIDLDQAMLKAMEYSIEHMRQSGKTIHSATFEAYEDFKKKVEDQ